MSYEDVVKRNLLHDRKPVKNLRGKTTPLDKPYAVYISHDGDWVWLVRKAWQADDAKPYARWFCAVYSPMTHGSYDLGDVYVTEVKRNVRVDPGQALSLIDYRKGRVISLWNRAKEVTGLDLSITEVNP